jgi:acyl-ACP thioesterase
VFRSERTVRFGDVSSDGRLRLDAVATYVQDVASDDTADAFGRTDSVWIVRRTVIEVHEPPKLGEVLTLSTWCGGIGSRWAERRVRMEGNRGGLVESGSVWVHTRLGTGRPTRLPDDVVEVSNGSSGGREVSARLRLPVAPADTTSTADVRRERWVVRAADLDLLGHVNNAAVWQAVEEQLGAAPPPASFRAELEHRDELKREPGVQCWSVGEASSPGGLSMWLVDDGTEPSPGTSRVAASVFGLR